MKEEKKDEGREAQKRTFSPNSNLWLRNCV